VESARCLAEVAGWFVSCLSPWRTRRSLESENPLEPAAEHAPDTVRGEAS
jgi:hypothetical protein